MRKFCWTCHRPTLRCFCTLARPFVSFADFALIVHPDEIKSTVGTAWILRRSISNIEWFRSKGDEIDSNSALIDALRIPGRVPLLLFPGTHAFNLSQDSHEAWIQLVPNSQRPFFIVIDGTWTQAHRMLRKSSLLRSLPRVSFETPHLSEYGFKKQPNSHCLSSVEGVHHVIEVLGSRQWAPLPALREHDQMIEIFRNMVRYQFQQIKAPPQFPRKAVSFGSDPVDSGNRDLKSQQRLVQNLQQSQMECLRPT